MFKFVIELPTLPLPTDADNAYIEADTELLKLVNDAADVKPFHE